MMSHSVAGVGVGGLSCAGRQSSASQKAQKGWLSRWTRKQWSRHWFVLKTGSLTYYRGPAAELCSFLDGVLDLSLIKHIEVQQPATSVGGSPSDLLVSSSGASGPANVGGGGSHNHHHHSNNTSNGQQHQGQPQFTFSLKMWNGECHLLGAASAAERSLWLEAINACTNEDDAATDSASSSDSSPTSNLSGKSIDIGRPLISRHYLNSKAQQQQQEQQLSLDLALTIKSAIKRREQQQQQQQLQQQQQQLQQQKAPLPPDVVVVERQQSQKHSEFARTSSMTAALQPIRHSISANLSSRDIKPIGSSQQLIQEPARSKQQQSSQTTMANCTISNSSSNDSRANQKQQEQSQALKRRLMCVNARNSFELNELKLVGRKQAPADLFRKRLCAGDQPHKVAARVSSESSDDDEEDDDDDEDDDNGDHDDVQHTEDSEEEKGDKEEDEEEDEDEEECGDNEKEEREADQEETADDQEDSPEDKQRQSEKLDPVSRCPTIAEQAVKNFLKKSSLLSDRPTTTTVAKTTQMASQLAAASQQRQKKRVTFDLSRSSQHQLTSSSESSASSDDSDESSLSPSSSVSSSEDEAEVAATAPAPVSSAAKQQPELGGPNKSSICKLDHQMMASHSPPALRMEPEADGELETPGELVRSFIERRELRLLSSIEGATAADDDASSAAQAEDTSCFSQGQSTLQLVSLPSSTSPPAVGMEGVQFNGGDQHSSDVIGSPESNLEDSSLPAKAHSIDLESSMNNAEEGKEHHLAVVVDELKSKLEQAQASICLLERKLTSSYASYSQLELSYKRLQGELSECEQLHRANLVSVQGRVDELSRELAASELKLAEARQKVLRYEEHLARSAGRPSAAQLRLAASQAKALNWLRATQQLPAKHNGSAFEHQLQSQQQLVTTTEAAAAAAATEEEAETPTRPPEDNKDCSLQPQQLAVPHHEPLLLMQHVKHTLAASNQQATLGLKLLNHSKQIQRKLNELELKVDKIHHQTASSSGGNNTPASSNVSCDGSACKKGPANEAAAKLATSAPPESSRTALAATVIASANAAARTTTSLVN